MKIKAGYRLTITSWENDGDHRHTKILDGLSKERVQFLIELCNLFKSENDRSNPGFGNLYQEDYFGEPNEEEEDEDAAKYDAAKYAILKVFEKHKAVLVEDELEDLNLSVADFEAADYMSEYLHYSSDYTFRVFEKFVVEYVPHEIEIKDVTKEFKKGK